MSFSRVLLHLSLVLAIVASSNANTFGLHRRDHADLGRLMKKRTPFDLLANQPSLQGEQTPITPATPSSSQTTPANSASVQVTSAIASSSAQASPSSSGGGDLLSSLVGGLVPTGSSTTSPTSTTPTTSSSTPGPSSAIPQTTVHAGNTPVSTLPQSVVYLTSSSIPTPTQTNATSSSAGISHAAVTVLIVIAASVGAAVIVWTIIRKWKFRPSSDFEGRMQPIDWQPGGSDEDGVLPGSHRPLSRASSFHSGSGNGHVDDQMRGPVGGYGTTTLGPIPDHDFTPGPAHLAPVGGYADLSRGSSPQPMVQEPLGMAPSINRPMQYEQHGVPLYHGYNGY